LEKLRHERGEDSGEMKKEAFAMGDGLDRSRERGRKEAA
jgi:hypothetical protein